MTTTENKPTPTLPLWKRSWVRRTVAIGALPALAIVWWLASPLFLDRTVDEAFPAAPVVESAPTTTVAPAAPVESVDEGTEASETTITPTTTPPAPIAIASGEFVGADDAHSGTGTATFYDVDGGTVLRFEQFEVTNGPDLRVNLVLADGSMVDLGELTGNIGNQNYEVPADVDLDSVESVLIYCRAFSVPFAEATLS